jgi:hypothetical protein
MFNSSPITATVSRQSTALAARERLFRDPAMRHNRPTYTANPDPPVSPTTVTFSAADLNSDPRTSDHRLSPAEQRRQAVQVAKSFKRHYLSEISYLDGCRLAVAVIRPTGLPHGPADIAQKICVDVDGNVSVIAYDAFPARARHLIVKRLLLAGGILATLAISLFTLLT